MAPARERVERCIAFVDLAGFTALTQAHGDEYAADVHDAFVSALAGACAASDDVVCVKHLGDGALLVSSSGEQMLAALLRGVEEQSDTELRLRVRAGVHAGSVLQVQSTHGVDFLGHTVNIAARLCGLAAPGELIFSADLLAAASAMGRPARALGPRLLRHVAAPIEAWAVALGTQEGLIDPVCHMTVGADALTSRISDQEWQFCSVACRDSFLAEHG